MMGSEVDLAVESILSKDCSTDMVDVDVSSETPNFVMTELANSFYQQQQHRTPPRPPARSSYSPSSSSVDQQQHSETETEGTPIFGANIVGHADLLNTPKNVKYVNETGCSSSAYFQRGVVETSSPLTASVNAAALAPGCCKPVDVEDSDIIHSISQDFLEEAILGVVYDAHRSAKCGLAFLDKFAAENDDKYKIVDEFRSLNNNCTDIFGQALAGGRSAKFVQQVDCFCPECHQSTAACRFAPHLEKCMGMGRNSFRKARTRLAASSAASHSSTSGVGHYSSVKNSKINNNNNNNNRRVVKNSWSDAEEGAEDDDDDWLSTRKKGQQRKRLVPKSASKKKVRSSPMKKKQSSSFMVSSESSEMLSNQLLGEDSNSNAGILLSDLLDTPPLYGSGGDDKGIRSRNDDSPMFTIGSGRGVQKLPDEDDDADYFDFDVPSPSL